MGKTPVPHIGSRPGAEAHGAKQPRPPPVGVQRVDGAAQRTMYGCDMAQSVCPWNVRFAKELTEPAFAPRDVLMNKDARQLARDLLGMSQEEFSRAFKGSPMKRAKLRGLKRNAAVVLGNVGTPDDVDLLMRALDDAEPLVREHAAWALRRIGSPAAAAALHDGLDVEPDAAIHAVLAAALDALAAPASSAGGGAGPQRGKPLPPVPRRPRVAEAGVDPVCCVPQLVRHLG